MITKGIRAIVQGKTTVLILDSEAAASLKVLLNVTVGIGEIPVNSILTPAELMDNLTILSQL